MTTPKSIELRKVTKGSKVLYEAVEDGEVLCSRLSRLPGYIAAFVVRKGEKYRISNCFSRPELIGKGDSARVNVYAIASVLNIK